MYLKKKQGDFDEPNVRMGSFFWTIFFDDFFRELLSQNGSQYFAPFLFVVF